MYGDALRPATDFTSIVDTNEYLPLFSVPKEEVTTADHFIGIYTSALIKDNGCLQIGIGKLSNALANALIFRQQQNFLYQALLTSSCAKSKFPIIEKIGGLSVQSNIVWQYPNVTIPAFLRDVVVTEYGIADCRSKTDADVIKALLNITDSRFQDDLLKLAKKAGKVEKQYEIPSAYKNNYPDSLTKLLTNNAANQYFPLYPFGSDLSSWRDLIAPSRKCKDGHIKVMK